METRIVDEPKVDELPVPEPTDPGKAIQTSTVTAEQIQGAIDVMEATKNAPKPQPEPDKPNRHQRRAQKKIMEKAMKKAKGKLDFLKKGVQVQPDPLQGIQVNDKPEGTISELYPITPEADPKP